MKKILAVILACSLLLLSGCTAKPTVAMLSYTTGKSETAYHGLCYSGLTRLSGKADIKGDQNTDENFADKLTKYEKTDLLWVTDPRAAGALASHAAAHEKQTVVLLDSAIDTPPANVAGVKLRVEEAAFMAGVLAQQTSRVQKLGFIGGENTAATQQYEYGFKAGALYFAKLSGSVVTVDTLYIGSTTDIQAGADAARMQYASGCDVLFTAAEMSGKGAISEAKGEGKKIIAVGADLITLAPENVLASVEKHPAFAVEALTKRFIGGDKLGGQNFTFGLLEGATSLTENKKLLEPQQHTALSDTADLIRGGKISVPYDKASYMAYSNALLG